MPVVSACIKTSSKYIICLFFHVMDLNMLLIKDENAQNSRLKQYCCPAIKTGQTL